MTRRGVEQGKKLGVEQVDVAILNVPTSKPLDEQTILREASSSGRLVIVADNHSVIGGLGEAVASLLLRSGVMPVFRQIALPDAFLDAGALPTLHDRYGISTEAMARSIKGRSEEHTAELQSLMRTSYAVFCLTTKNYSVEH